MQNRNKHSGDRSNLRQWMRPGRVAAVAAGAFLLSACGGRDDTDVATYETTDPAVEQRETETTAYSQTADQTAQQPAYAQTDNQQAQQNQQDQQGQRQEQDSAEFVLNEEELDVEKRQVESGGVLVRKDVVTKEVQEPVELRREEVDVVRLSPEEARQRQEAGEMQGDEQFSEEEVFIPLTREEAVVDKDVETRGGIQVTTNEETEQQNVDATLRREVVDVERQGNAQMSEDSQGQTYASSQDQQQSGQQNQQQGYAASSQNQQGQDLEQRIRQDLRSAQDLSLDEQQINEIEIEVEQQRVTLSGTVPSEQVAQQIEQRVNEIEGVNQVENQLEAEGQTQAAE